MGLKLNISIATFLPLRLVVGNKGFTRVNLWEAASLGVILTQILAAAISKSPRLPDASVVLVLRYPSEPRRYCGTTNMASF